MSTGSGHEPLPSGLPRFVVVEVDLAKGIIQLLEGMGELLRLGDLNSGQLLLLTNGKRLPGDEVSDRLAGIVGEITRAIRDQVDEP